MQVDASLLWTSMAHQRSNDGDVDAPIHQVSCERVSQRTRCHVVRQAGTTGSGANDLTNVIHSKATLADVGSEQRAALTVVQKIGEQLGVYRFRDRNDTRPISLGFQHQQFVPFAVHVRYIE